MSSLKLRVFSNSNRQYGSHHIVTYRGLCTLSPFYLPFFRRLGLSSYLLSNLTVLAANIFSDPVSFRAIEK
nr:MAG TPA: hypothetical protein [Caudoviricetes sp.]